MFKEFLLNREYSFDLEGNCKRNNQLVTLGNSDTVNIEIDGKSYLFDRTWISLITHYEVDLPLKMMLNISFTECKSKVINLHCGKLMLIRNPIILEDGFRIIPGFTRFAINCEGVVKVIKTGKILKEAIGPYGYPYVNIYDPDKFNTKTNKWRSVNVHILLARAFIKNSAPSVMCFVNHKNGNKLDYRLKNLEWTSSKKNNVHAVENNLRNDNFPCKIRDILTGNILHYHSLSSCLSSIGIHKRISIQKNINGQAIPRLFLNRYEVKLLNDTSDWFYKDNSDIKQQKVTGPYQAIQIDTGLIFESNTVKELSKLTNISDDQIRNVLWSIVPKQCNGFHFRVKTNNPWPETYELVINCKPREFKVTNIVSGETLYFSSLSKTRNFLSIDKRTLKNRLQTKKAYGDFLIEEILDTNSPTQ